MVELPEEIPKEAIEFLIRFIGANASALEQLGLEWYHGAHPEAQGKFPFTRIEEHLPMTSDLIVGGLSVAPWVIGLLTEEDPLKLTKDLDLTTKEMLKEFAKGLRQFGEGGILYSAPMLVRTTAVHNIPAPEGETEAKVGAPRGRVIAL